MSNSSLVTLNASGQSPWIDFIRRAFMKSGGFSQLIENGEIVGATSNPAIFEKAINGGDEYDEQIRQLVASGMTDKALVYNELAITDIQMAADVLRPVFDKTHGLDGYISLEVAPTSAFDTAATIAEAKYLWGRVNRPNLMVKVPATPEGIPAVQQLIADGLNINVTLIFALDVYETVAKAYISGLQQRAAAGHDVTNVHSVASFFVSRVDSEVDKRLGALIEQTADTRRKEQLQSLFGKAAIANAKVAYRRYVTIFAQPDFTALAAKGAHPQRCLWASTSTKNPTYRDVIYVEELIGPQTVNTMPPATIDAFRDHGIVRETLTANLATAEAELQQLESFGISMQDVTAKLLADGVTLFVDPFHVLLDAVGKKIESFRV